jgi:hypothetical protein
MIYRALTIPITAMNRVTNKCQCGKHQFRKKDKRTGAKSQLGHLTLEDFLFQDEELSMSAKGSRRHKRFTHHQWCQRLRSDK